jgi:DNA-binding NarL/FixJ family response regulator
VPLSQVVSAISVLIVDDFDPWRRFVADLLTEAGGVYTTSFASDGVEAVRKAAELRPHIILMDVALPTLSGFEAAGQIREFVPESKIVFVTSLSDPEIARTAFRAGGRGYVLKADAGEQLLKGMEAVLLGRYFLSASLSDIDNR